MYTFRIIWFSPSLQVSAQRTMTQALQTADRFCLSQVYLPAPEGAWVWYLSGLTTWSSLTTERLTFCSLTMTSHPTSSPATIHPTAPISRTIQVSSLWIPPASLVARHLPGLSSFPSQPEPHGHHWNYSPVLYSHSLTTHTLLNRAPTLAGLWN